MATEPFSGNPIGYADTVNGTGQALSALDCRYGVGAGAKCWVQGANNGAGAFFTLQVSAAAADHVTIEAALGLSNMRWIQDAGGRWDYEFIVDGDAVPSLDIPIDPTNPMHDCIEAEWEIKFSTLLSGSPLIAPSLNGGVITAANMRRGHLYIPEDGASDVSTSKGAGAGNANILTGENAGVWVYMRTMWRLKSTFRALLFHMHSGASTPETVVGGMYIADVATVLTSVGLIPTVVCNPFGAGTHVRAKYCGEGS